MGAVVTRIVHPLRVMANTYEIHRVLVVEDDPALTATIRQISARSSGLAVVGEASTGAEAVAKFRSLRPRVLLVDVHVPRDGGLDVIRQVRSLSPAVVIVAFATHRVDAMVERALAAGARAFLATGSLAGELPDTVERLVCGSGASGLSEWECTRRPSARPATLTDREAEVLRSAAAGHTNREIARLLSISDETVKGHMKNIAGKLGTRDRTEAVAMAYRNGLIAL